MIDREPITEKRVDVLVGPDEFDYYYELTRVRITVKEVYPGTKYNDTCVTEFFAF